LLKDFGFYPHKKRFWLLINIITKFNQAQQMASTTYRITYHAVLNAEKGKMELTNYS
jgi:hypothetical protein